MVNRNFPPFICSKALALKLIAINGKRGGQSPLAVCITNESHDNLFVFHADGHAAHALAIAKGEEKDKGVVGGRNS